jgi:toxin ParE1/3/4
MYKVVWSELAVQRIEEIAHFIALDAPLAAIKWCDKIFDKGDSLKENPSKGRVVPEIGDPNRRELIVGNYIIVYKISGKTIQISTVKNQRESRL